MSLIKIDVEKYRVIAHQQRRAARAEKFKPYDEVIMKQIPGADVQQAEVARQAIREKYTGLQTQMDAAQTANELKLVLLAME